MSEVPSSYFASAAKEKRRHSVAATVAPPTDSAHQAPSTNDSGKSAHAWHEGVTEKGGVGRLGSMPGSPVEHAARRANRPREGSLASRLMNMFRKRSNESIKEGGGGMRRGSVASSVGGRGSFLSPVSEGDMSTMPTSPGGPEGASPEGSPGRGKYRRRFSLTDVFRRLTDKNGQLTGFNDKYILGKKLGEGGFSTCREAILRNPRAIVGEAKIRRAVKITQISETAIEEDEAATAEEKKNRKSLNPYLRYIKGRQRRQSKMTPEEIHREVYLLKLAQHPNIVLVHDVFLYDASCYIVMERYDADLESVDCLFWPASKVTEATAHILLAVHHLHSLNICHRDIKPQNFFVTNEGRLVLSDFGLAVETECEHAGLSDTSGSLPYLAPEVLAGDYGRKADMWSVGVTLFWIITGFTPFTGFEDHDVARAILKGQYSTKACRHAPKECRDLIKKLLEPNPKRRLTAADALRHPYVVPALDNIPWAAQQLSTDFYQNHKKFSKDYRTHRDEKSHQSPSDEATNKSKGDSKEGHKEKDGQKEGQAQNYKTGYRMTDTYYRHPLLRSPFAGASFDIHDYLDDDTGTSALLSNGPREVVY